MKQQTTTPTHTPTWRRLLLGIVLTPVLLFLLLSLLLYLPPIQRALISTLTEKVERDSQLQLHIKDIRLHFPLQLTAHDIQIESAPNDTLLQSSSVDIDICFLPLFAGQIDVKGIELHVAHVDSKSYLPNTHIRGRIGTLSLQKSNIAPLRHRIDLSHLQLKGAQLAIALADSCLHDSTSAPLPWYIHVDALDIEQSTLRLALATPMPTNRSSADNNATWIGAHLGTAQLKGASIHLPTSDYRLTSADFQNCRYAYYTQGQTGTWSRSNLPDSNTTHPLQSTDTFSLSPLRYTDNIGALEQWQPDWEKAATQSPHQSSRLAPFNSHNIAAAQVALRVDSLRYDSLHTLELSLQELSLTDRTGLRISRLQSSIHVDSTHVSLPDLQIETPASHLAGQLDMPFSAWQAHPTDTLQFLLKGDIMPSDIAVLTQGIVDSSLWDSFPAEPFTLDTRCRGNGQTLYVYPFHLHIDPTLSISIDATCRHLLTSPDIALDYRVSTGSDFPKFIERYLPSLKDSFTCPTYMPITGKFHYSDEQLHLSSRLPLHQGLLQMSGRLRLSDTQYGLHLSSTNFPLGQLFPQLQAQPLTAQINAQGALFNWYAPHSYLQSKAQIDSFSVEGIDLSGLKIDAGVHEQKAVATLHISNPTAQAELTLEAQLRNLLSGRLTGRATQLSLQEMGATQSAVNAGGHIEMDWQTDSSFEHIQAQGALQQLFFYSPTLGFSSEDIHYKLASAPDSTYAHIASGDLSLTLRADSSLSAVGAECGQFASLLQAQLAVHQLDELALRHALPNVRLRFDAATDNPLQSLMQLKNSSFNRLRLRLNTSDSLGISAQLNADSLVSNGFLIDNAHIGLSQDSTGLLLDSEIYNHYPYNPNRFKLQLKGKLQNKDAKLHLSFYDKHQTPCINFGVQTRWTNEGFQCSVFPAHPLIAYRQFSINPDNYLFYGYRGKIQGNINLIADDNTGLKLYTASTDSVNDITLSVNHINLGELSHSLPTLLPDLGGFLSGDLHVVDHQQSLSAMSDLNIENFDYAGAPLGTLGLGITYLPQNNGLHVGNVMITSNEQTIFMANGSYSDATDTLHVVGDLTDCPLPLLNGFLAGSNIEFDGKGNGQFVLQGAISHPLLNGQLSLDSARIYSEAYGFDLHTTPEAIKIENGWLRLDQYPLYSSGKNPLTVDGTIDMRDFSKIGLGLSIKAKEFELINTPRSTKSELFGKMYANYKGSIKGRLDNLSVRGQLDVLHRTNMTYVMDNSPLTDQNTLEGLVEFVNFADSAYVVPEEEESASSYDLALAINIHSGAQFHCFLTEDGSSYADMNGSGHLMFRITQLGNMLLSGRITADGGEMKYQLPIIPLRTFHIQPDSYVEFTGNPMNPTLNIRAEEQMKVIVPEDERQTAVVFDVGVHLTQDLENMGLKFIIAAPDNLTMRNQLAAMSEEERNKVAVAMMATGMYINDKSKSAGGFKANNALNAFLQNEIQNIAGKALKSVDISLGVEEGRSSIGTQTTDYSFRFSKRLFNDRVRMIIGGRVSAGVEADNSAENLINNVSIEYRINKNSNRFLRLFYDRNLQDPLEGELINTGVGYSMRRSATRLGDLFIFWRDPEKIDQRRKEKKR